MYFWSCFIRLCIYCIAVVDQCESNSNFIKQWFQVTKNGNVAELIKENPGMKSSILDSFKFALTPFFEKLSLKHTLVHQAMKDFFDVCDEAPLRSVSTSF